MAPLTRPAAFVSVSGRDSAFSHVVRVDLQPPHHEIHPARPVLEVRIRGQRAQIIEELPPRPDRGADELIIRIASSRKVCSAKASRFSVASNEDRCSWPCPKWCSR